MAIVYHCITAYYTVKNVLSTFNLDVFTLHIIRRLNAVLLLHVMLIYC